MANPEHVAVVRKGTDAIAEWRQCNPLVPLDLSGAELSLTRLTGADLSQADLSQTNLVASTLLRANLSQANLRGASLGRANLLRADLSRASLCGASALLGILVQANLSEADARGADLGGAHLAGANLTRTNLGGADLTVATLQRTQVKGCDVSGARFGSTSLGDLDVSQVLGLATVRHEYPSSVGVDTLISSFRGAGNKLTPDLEVFFRGAGVPADLLRALPRLVAEVKYYDCFISYGQPDLAFAKKLCQDLEAKGVPCWLYDMDATVGEPTWREIGKMRREADKMVVLCSARALVRPGVLKEIEEQIDEDPDKVVPISLDDLWKHTGFKVMRDSRDLKPFLMDRNYADFANLSYEEALQRLLAGLKRQDR